MVDDEFSVESSVYMSIKLRENVTLDSRIIRNKSPCQGLLYAGGGTRTRTDLTAQRILSPLRLPVPSPRRRLFLTQRNRLYKGKEGGVMRRGTKARRFYIKRAI
jgi:hypothetical protein